MRIAAALASIYDRHIGAIKDNLFRPQKSFAWSGSNFCERLVSVLSRRLQLADAAELINNPLGASYKLDPGDATLFIEGSVDDGLIEDLLFAFVVLDWKDFKAPDAPRTAEVLPVYAVLKHLFLGGEIHAGAEPVRCARTRGFCRAWLRATSRAPRRWPYTGCASRFCVRWT